MTAYLDRDGFRALTIAPGSYVDDAEASDPGWVLAQLTHWSAGIDARLRKRYAVPFASPYPERLLTWLAAIVTLRLYLKRGVDPTDAQFELVRLESENALAELKEAANSDTGLFELPLRADTTATGITKGAPKAFTQVSPYSPFDTQRDEAEFDP